MKLGSLKSAIRSTKGSPTLRVEVMPGVLATLALMKGPLQEALDAAFPGGKAVETGLTLHVEGDNAVLRPEQSDAPYAIKASAPGPLLDIMEAPIQEQKAAPAASLLDAPKPVSLLDDSPAKPASLLDSSPAPASSLSGLLV